MLLNEWISQVSHKNEKINPLVNAIISHFSLLCYERQSVTLALSSENKHGVEMAYNIQEPLKSKNV